MFDKDDGVLFAPDALTLPHGRVRRGLDADVKAARAADRTLPAAGVAALRSLADQIDALERSLRSPAAKPYDRVPLTGLVRQFDSTYGLTFGGTDDGSDPLARAFAEFVAAAQAGRPADRDPAGSLPAD